MDETAWNRPTHHSRTCPACAGALAVLHRAHVDAEGDRSDPAWVAVCRDCRRLVSVAGDGTGRCTIVHYGAGRDPGADPWFDLVLTVTAGDDGVSVALTGDLDHSTAWILRDELARMAEQGLSPSTVDLSGAAFIDSGGIDVLVEVTRLAAAAGHHLAVTGATPRCRELLAITGDDLLDAG